MKRIHGVGFIVALAAGFVASKVVERGGRLGAGVVEAQIAPGLAYKQVRCEPQTRMDAVVITKVIVAGREVQCGLTLGPDDTQTVTPFQAGDNWLSEMDIYLFDRTDKTIVSVGIPLGFPDTGNGHTEPQSIYNVQIGRMPKVDAFSHKTGKPFAIDPKLKPVAFVPGQTLVLHVADYLADMKEYVEKQMLLSQVTHVEIHRGAVYFEDGMRWQAGNGFSVPDASHPGNFKQLDPGRFFPGEPTENWPPPR
jgi:hypothetical protein